MFHLKCNVTLNVNDISKINIWVSLQNLTFMAVLKSNIPLKIT